MVNKVGCLLGYPLVGFLTRGTHHLFGFLLNLGAGPGRVGEQRRRVGAIGPAQRAVGDRALEHGQGLKWRIGLELTPVKAGSLAGVTGWPGRLD